MIDHYKAAAMFHSGFDAQEIAHKLNCSVGSIYRALGKAGVPLPYSRRPMHLTWTPEMRAALITGALHGDSVSAIARKVGVSREALVIGALEIIRDEVRENCPFVTQEEEIQ